MNNIEGNIHNESSDIEGIISELDQIIENSDEIDFYNVIQIHDKIAAECNTEELSIYLADAKISIMIAFSDYEECEKGEPFFIDLKSLTEKYPSSHILKKKYAKGIVVLINGYLTAHDELDRNKELYTLLCEYAANEKNISFNEEFSFVYLYYIYYYIIKTEEIERADEFMSLLKSLYEQEKDWGNIQWNYFEAKILYFNYYYDSSDLQSALHQFSSIEDIIIKYGNNDDDVLIYGLSTSSKLITLLIKDDQIENAELYYEKLKKTVPDIVSEKVFDLYLWAIAESAVEIFNHYILSDDVEKANIKYREVEKLYENYATVVARFFARAVYGMFCHFNTLQYAEKENYYLSMLENLYSGDYHEEITETWIRALCIFISSESAKNEGGKHIETLNKVKDAVQKNNSDETYSYLGIALHDVILSGIKNKDNTITDIYLPELGHLASSFPEKKEIQESYLKAISYSLHLYKDNFNEVSVNKIFNIIKQYKADKYTSDSISQVLYNLTVLYSNHKHTQKADEIFQTLYSLMQLYPSPEIILRVTKSAYNLHDDYSEAGLFNKAEEKYSLLKSLSNRYLDSELKIKENPLGLEVALRQASAALNQSICLNNKQATHKKNFINSLFSSSKKEEARIAELIQDVLYLNEKWKNMNSAKLQEHFVNIQKLKK